MPKLQLLPAQPTPDCNTPTPDTTAQGEAPFTDRDPKGVLEKPTSGTGIAPSTPGRAGKLSPAAPHPEIRASSAWPQLLLQRCPSSPLPWGCTSQTGWVWCTNSSLRGFSRNQGNQQDLCCRCTAKCTFSLGTEIATGPVLNWEPDQFCNDIYTERSFQLTRVCRDRNRVETGRLHFQSASCKLINRQPWHPKASLGTKPKPLSFKAREFCITDI